MRTGCALVVDDEKNIRLTLSRALGSMGLEVETAGGGREALSLLEKHPFDLVLLDLKMPGMGGLDVLPRLRTLHPDLPVIILTAHGTAHTAVQAMKLGATDFVQKPFTPEEFRALVRRVEEVGPSNETDLPAAPVQAEERAQTPESRPYRVVVPVADPRVEHHLLRLAAASAHAYRNGEVIAVNVIKMPSQTPLDTIKQPDHPWAEKQQTLLESARLSARELSVELRARTIASHDASEAVLKVLREERADHVLMAVSEGTGELNGVTVNAITKKATCEVTLVKAGRDQHVQHVAALVNEGPHAPHVARRAFEFAQSTGIAHLTLLNVQPPRGDEPANSKEAGRDVIRTVAKRAGIPDEKYMLNVQVTDEVTEALLEAAEDYDTVCIGASRSTAVAQSLFGSLPKILAEGTPATVAVVRRPTYPARTAMRALSERWSRKGA